MAVKVHLDEVDASEGSSELVLDAALLMQQLSFNLMRYGSHFVWIQPAWSQTVQCTDDGDRDGSRSSSSTASWRFAKNR
jgi:hypothetical protein